MARAERRPYAGVCAVVLAILIVAACGRFHDLRFTQDHRLTILSPAHRALVRAPILIRWRITEFRIAPAQTESPSQEAGYFALFVDRAPMPPGDSVRDAAGRNRLCEDDPHCDRAGSLAAQGIYTTAQTSYRLRSVPALATGESVQLHTVTIVLLDTSGHRIGESAWLVQFTIPKGLPR